MSEEEYDESHLEKRYFVDGKKFNCPYCKIRSIEYRIVDTGDFDWTRAKKCYFYVVKCVNCQKESFHLSNFQIFRSDSDSSHFYMPPHHWAKMQENRSARVPIQKGGQDMQLLDEAFFYHQPTSFFVIDNRIPEVLRKLIDEADGCSKMPYLVGASGCLRKTIYELLEIQEIVKEENGRDLNYEDRIKRLKDKFKNIDSEYFDILASIQSMTSDNLHEGSWDSFDLPTFKLLLETTKEILQEIYVLPAEKKNKKSAIQQLRESFNKKTKS